MSPQLEAVEELRANLYELLGLITAPLTERYRKRLANLHGAPDEVVADIVRQYQADIDRCTAPTVQLLTRLPPAPIYVSRVLN